MRLLTFAKVLLALSSVLLVTVILLQSGRSAGLGAITGGGNEGGASRRGKGTDPMLARTTSIVAVIFFGASIWIAWLVTH